MGKIFGFKIPIKQEQIISFLIGILGTTLAYYFLHIGKEDLFKFIVSVAGHIGGPIAGLFLLGFFIPKSNSKHAWVGLIIGIFFSLYTADPFNLKYPNLKINPFIVPIIGILASFIPGYLLYFLTSKINSIKNK